MFDPYGRVTVLAADGTTVRTASLYGNPWTFGGRRLDGETGLMQFRFRYYDTGLGRFIGRDPIGYKGGINLYEYVGTQPSQRTDPMGLASWPDNDAGRWHLDNGDESLPSSHPKRRLEAASKAQMWWREHVKDFRKYCFFDEWNKMVQKLKSRLFRGFFAKEPRIWFDVDDDNLVFSTPGYLPLTNGLHLPFTYTRSIIAHEMFHVASSYYLGSTGSESTDHELTDAVERYELNALEWLADYVRDDCRNGTKRDAFLLQARRVESGAAASAGLDKALSYDFDYKKYLKIIDDSCCCGKNVTPVKGSGGE